jgi:L-alanine-DL-glutamate epimerase-like enolase superfamily enzyme
VRDAVGDDIDLMVDFNQALNLADAWRRSWLSLDRGTGPLRRFRQLRPAHRLTAELKTAIQIGENFDGPRDVHFALQKRACDLIMPDFMRIGGVTGFLRSAAIAGAAAIFLSVGRRACYAHVGERTLTGMAGLELPGFATALRNPRRAGSHPRGAGLRHRVG